MLLTMGFWVFRVEKKNKIEEENRVEFDPGKTSGWREEETAQESALEKKEKLLGKINKYITYA